MKRYNLTFIGNFFADNNGSMKTFHVKKWHFVDSTFIIRCCYLTWASIKWLWRKLATLNKRLKTPSLWHTVAFLENCIVSARFLGLANLANIVPTMHAYGKGEYTSILFRLYLTDSTRCWRGNWPPKKIHWPWDTYFLKRNDMGDNVY